MKLAAFSLLITSLVFHASQSECSKVKKTHTASRVEPYKKKSNTDESDIQRIRNKPIIDYINGQPIYITIMDNKIQQSQSPRNRKIINSTKKTVHRSLCTRNNDLISIVKPVEEAKQPIIFRDMPPPLSLESEQEQRFRTWYFNDTAPSSERSLNLFILNRDNNE